MLSFNNVSLRRGTRLLFSSVTFTVFAGQKVGVVGANGVGKSSLFALVRGELQSDVGDVTVPPKLVIAHVAQEMPATDRPAIEYVIDGDRELRSIQGELRQAEEEGNGSRQATLHARLEAVDGYTARARAAKLMDGLGFAPEQMDQSVHRFSGGWRMRLNLAQALMCRSDLLLLDEPTNHLDLDAVIWLQEWLRSYAGTLMLISHDRDFLDFVADQIAHIEHENVRLYAGNYSAFELRRAEELAQQQAAYEKQQREINHIQKFVDRFRAKATKARQAQSRVKALERLERIAPAHVDSPFHFSFLDPGKVPNPLLQLEDVAAGYDKKQVFSGVTLTLSPGDRVGLLGRNGAGKSTLIKLLASELVPSVGVRQGAADLRIGYFAQHQLEQLRAEDSPVTHLQRLDSRASEQSMRDFLGGFGFTGDMALQPVAPFSGGEKARLVLALLVYQRPNLLLLDEPTNHLDLEMRHALNLALQDFEGAMVVVSHDRHLLRTVTDQLLLVAHGSVTPFDGDLDDYRRWLAEQQKGGREQTVADATENSATARKEQRRLDADKRKRLQPLRKEVQRLEAAMERLQTSKGEIETQLTDNSLYEESAKARLKELLLEQSRIDQELGAAEEAWLLAHERLEQAEQN